MRSPLTIVAWLRGLKRGYKFAILLVAAWAPFLFPEHPVATGLLMGLCTAVFFIATGPSKPRSAANLPDRLTPAILRTAVPSLKFVMLTLAVAPVGACVTPRAQPEPHLPPGHNFSYSTEDREKVNLVQAFDDGANTFLQFKEPPSPDIQIRREIGEENIAYTPEDRFLVIQGVYDRLRVSAAENSATVINQAVSAAPTRVNSMIDSPVPAQNPPWAPSSIPAGSVEHRAASAPRAGGRNSGILADYERETSRRCARAGNNLPRRPNPSSRRADRRIALKRTWNASLHSKRRWISQARREIRRQQCPRSRSMKPSWNP